MRRPGEIVQLVEIFRAKIVDVSKSTLTIEASGSEDKVSALEDLLKPFGIRRSSGQAQLPSKEAIG